MRKSYLLYSAIGLLLLLTMFLGLRESPIRPVALDFPLQQLQPNDRLNGLDILFAEICDGCEDLEISVDGNALWTGHRDGRLLLISLREGAERFQEILRFKGRPLGLKVLGDTLAWVCVAGEGLARVNLREETYEIVVNGYSDTLFQLIDDLDVGADGRVYFTDASDKFGDADLQLDLLEGRPNGALYRYDPSSGHTKRLLDHLHFANGVAVSADQSFVLVNETGAFRTQRYWLRGPQAGRAEIFVAGLPGWPDGISLGTDGLFYLTQASPRTAVHDFVLPRPWTRTLLTKLPRALWPGPGRGNRVFALNREGEIVLDLMDADPDIYGLASVEKVGNELWFGSVYDRGIARLSTSD